MSTKRKKLNRELLNAVVMRDIKKAQSLLEQGADVNARDTDHYETSLILATRFVEVAMVQILLDAKADVDARDDWGRTALFYASVKSEVFGRLIKAGADIHARDEQGDTILSRKVSESPSLNEIEELLQLGIDPRVRNADEQTALDKAESLGLENIVERLRAATAV